MSGAQQKQFTELLNADLRRKKCAVLEESSNQGHSRKRSLFLTPKESQVCRAAWVYEQFCLLLVLLHQNTLALVFQCKWQKQVIDMTVTL